MTATLTTEELLELPAVVDVPTAGRAYGISERHAYELARQDRLPVPVLRLGRLLRVRRADLVADLLGAQTDCSAGAPPALRAVAE